MEQQLQYRVKTKSIAICDLVLTSLTLWIPVAFVILAYESTIHSNEIMHKENGHVDVNGDLGVAIPTPTVSAADQEESTSFGIYGMMLWVAVVTSFVCVLLQIIGAMKLLQATQITKDPSDAAKLARFWRNLTVFFTVFLIGASFLGKQDGFGLLFTVATAATRICAIYFVQKFIFELDKAGPQKVLLN